MNFAHNLEDVLSSDRLRNFNLNLGRRRIIEQNRPVDYLHPTLGKGSDLDQCAGFHLAEVTILNFAQDLIQQPVIPARKGQQIGTHAIGQEQSNLLTAFAQDFRYLLRWQIQQPAHFLDFGATQCEIAEKSHLARAKGIDIILKRNVRPFAGEGFDNAMFDIALVTGNIHGSETSRKGE